MKKDYSKIFNHPMFGEVRTVVNGDEIRVCLMDVCKALGLQAKHVIERLDKGTVLRGPLITAGGVQQANFVNEEGLYEVIFQSRKPIAKDFRKWVMSEVLPSIPNYRAVRITLNDKEYFNGIPFFCYIYNVHVHN